MQLTYLKEFLVSTLIGVLAPHETIDQKNMQLYLKDFRFDIDPAIENMDSMLAEIEKLCDMEIDYDAELVQEMNFAFQFRYDHTFKYRHGLSLQLLNKIAQTFYTDNLYVGGDGYQTKYSEDTVIQYHEMIFHIIPQNKKQLIDNYMEWIARKE